MLLVGPHSLHPSRVASTATCRSRTQGILSHRTSPKILGDVQGFPRRLGDAHELTPATDRRTRGSERAESSEYRHMDILYKDLGREDCGLLCSFSCQDRSFRIILSGKVC